MYFIVFFSFYLSVPSAQTVHTQFCTQIVLELFRGKIKDVGSNQMEMLIKRLSMSARFGVGLFTLHDNTKCSDPFDLVLQLRVLYRSSSSGLDWPKSIRAGSDVNPEPPGGQ